MASFAGRDEIKEYPGFVRRESSGYDKYYPADTVSRFSCTNLNRLLSTGRQPPARAISAGRCSPNLVSTRIWPRLRTFRSLAPQQTVQTFMPIRLSAARNARLSNTSLAMRPFTARRQLYGSRKKSFLWYCILAPPRGGRGAATGQLPHGPHLSLLRC